MESVPYRNTKLLVKIIPKGTLLFRQTKTPENDIKGVPIDNGKRCITPNFNVFFYPNPFAADFAFPNYRDELGTTVYVYILKKDIKVFSLINPSKYSRFDKTRKNTFIKRCSTIRKGCMPRELNRYDACLSSTIIKKYPDIVGIISIARKDSKMMKQLKEKANKQYVKYFHLTKDKDNTSGIPELSLHPLIARPSSDVISDESVVHDTNFMQIKSFSMNDKQSIVNFMKTHAVYNPDTFYYTYKE